MLAAPGGYGSVPLELHGKKCGKNELGNISGENKLSDGIRR